MSSIAALKLPFVFDTSRLLADLDRVAESEWVAHFNTSDFEGDWCGVALRSVGGGIRQIYPDPSESAVFQDTELIARCPYFAEVLAAFECPIEAARLLKLRAGSSIREHRDYRLGYEDGEVRIHVPVVTDPAVAFYLAGERVPLAPGECWYLNVNLPHRVENRATIDRVHLVFDCRVNPWLGRLIEEAMHALPPAPTPAPDVPGTGCRTDWAAFQQYVLEDERLFARLSEISEREVFVSAVQEIARAGGWEFAADDLRGRMRETRRAFLRRQGRLVG